MVRRVEGLGKLYRFNEVRVIEYASVFVEASDWQQTARDRARFERRIKDI